MKTNNLMLLPYWIYTESLDLAWHKSGWMHWYEEIKDGIPHGNSKMWWRDGRLYCHHTYENGKLVKSE